MAAVSRTQVNHPHHPPTLEVALQRLQHVSRQRHQTIAVLGHCLGSLCWHNHHCMRWLLVMLLLVFLWGVRG